jgi:mannosyltransferase OCH1-like enzyme
MRWINLIFQKNRIFWFLFAMALIFVVRIIYLVRNGRLEISFCDGTCFHVAPYHPSSLQIKEEFICTWNPGSELLFTNENAGLPTPRWTTGVTSAREIPHHIHQSWKTKDLPLKFVKWSDKWKSLHHGWNYTLWTDNTNRALVKSRYPWLLPTYDSLPSNIMRADFSRALYMHSYGGIYSDLDLEPLKDLSPLLRSTKKPIILAFMTKEDHPHGIPNAWMASVPGHPFWMGVMTEIVKRASLNSPVETITGPVMLTHFARSWFESCKTKDREWEPQNGVEAGDLAVLRSGLIYPYDWTNPGSLGTICSAESASSFDPSECQKLFPEAFTITYWTHSWGSDKAKLND